ncbi:hypothetical protein LJR153_007265 [Paenibacillus sp. LjRoot153]|uniref:hypothetical protein n=1 Tax=Paenibacillus sp. LjRoot153 TaxID=3342270 RepID=UPI003ED11AA4
MSDSNKFQEELDVLAYNARELETLKKQIAASAAKAADLQADLKDFNRKRNIEWEPITDSKPMHIAISEDQVWDNLVSRARSTQAKQACYSDFLTDLEIANCVQAVTDLRKQFTDQYSTKMVDELRDNFLQSLIGPFGLSLNMLRAFDGGAIPTVHNANEGIIPNDESGDKLRDYQSSYNRQNYAPQKEMNKQRKERFQDPEPINDGYTNKELNRDGRSHIEHIVSAHELHRDDWARLFLSSEKRKELVNSAENILWTDGSLNQSKSDEDLLKWMNVRSKKDPTKTNAEYFEIDQERAKEAYKKAHRMKNVEVASAVGKEVLVQCGKTSLKMGFRKALGYILYELAKEVFNETRAVLQKKKQQSIKLKDELTIRFKAIVTRVVGKWKEIIKQFMDGAIAGFLSELLVFIINQFITTMKRLVRIIKEGFMSLVQMIRFVLNPPEGMLREEVYQQCLKMGVTILITSGGILLDELIEKFLLSNTVTAPFAAWLSPVITGLLTGLVLSLVMYGLDKLDLFGAKEKRIDRQISQRVMDELWQLEAEFRRLMVYDQ